MSYVRCGTRDGLIIPSKIDHSTVYDMGISSTTMHHDKDHPHDPRHIHGCVTFIVAKSTNTLDLG